MSHGARESSATHALCADEVGGDGDDRMPLGGETLRVLPKKSISFGGKKDHIYLFSLQQMLHFSIAATRFQQCGQEDSQHQRQKNGENDEKQHGGKQDQRAGLDHCEEDADDAQDKGEGAEASDQLLKILPMCVERRVCEMVVKIAEKEAMGCHSTVLHRFLLQSADGAFSVRIHKGKRGDGSIL